MQLDIELRCLAESCLDSADLGNLRADVEMNQAQTVAHIFLIKHVERFQEFGTGQPEF